MKRIHYGIAALFVAHLAAFATPTLAAESADLAVKGMIRPAACDISLSNSGAVDFGNIFVKDLSDTTFTRVGRRNLTLTVTCDAAATFGITATDGRSGTATPGAAAFLHSNQNDAAAFGVGSVDGTNVGAYLLYRAEAASGDGNAIASLATNNGGTTWSAAGGADNAIVPGARMHAWAATGQTAPGSFQSVSQTYTVALALPKTGDLPDLTQAVPIDGLATLTINYL